MNSRRFVTPPVVAVLVLLGAGVLLFIGILVGVGRLQFAGRAAERELEMNIYSAALLSYSNTFGTLPPGSNVQVTAALMGQNSARSNFLLVATQQVNQVGEFVDPLRRPYRIVATTNTFRIEPPNH